MSTNNPTTTGRQRAGDRVVQYRGFALGPFETNCYVVNLEGDSACWIVDAGFEPAEMIEHVRGTGLEPRALLLTHAHADHIAGVREVVAAFPGLPVRVHAAERDWLLDPMLNLSGGMGMPVTAPETDRTLEDGEELELSRTRWRVLHTPGHSPGGVTIHCADAGIALVGDALFAGSIGRHDFPGSSFETLAASIRERLYALPDETVVLPGHGPATTIGREKRSNPFVRAD